MEGQETLMVILLGVSANQSLFQLIFAHKEEGM